MPDKAVSVFYISKDIEIDDLNSAFGDKAAEIRINKYYSGDTAPAGRHASAAMWWSETALYIRFEANQTEPVIISETANLTTKSIGLWDRDVCEIFVAPDKNEPRKYFEFEAAPNGEWLDVFIDYSGDERKADWVYASGMETASEILEDKIVTVIKIPWTAFGAKPKLGDIWLGNLLRCVGKDPDRGYLTWQPTFTAVPNFHVPESFGEFLFV